MYGASAKKLRVQPHIADYLLEQVIGFSNARLIALVWRFLDSVRLRQKMASPNHYSIDRSEALRLLGDDKRTYNLLLSSGLAGAFNQEVYGTNREILLVHRSVFATENQLNSIQKLISALEARRKVVPATVLILKDLEQRTGKLTAEDLVKEARSKDHPLHDRFCWDDKKAAHKQRIETARALIRESRMKSEHGEVPVFVRDPSLPSSEQGYCQLEKLKGNSGIEAVMSELIAAEGHLKRARDIAGFIGYPNLLAAAAKDFEAAKQELSSTVISARAAV